MNKIHILQTNGKTACGRHSHDAVSTSRFLGYDKLQCKTCLRIYNADVTPSVEDANTPVIPPTGSVNRPAVVIVRKSDHFAVKLIYWDGETQGWNFSGSDDRRIFRTRNAVINDLDDTFADSGC